MPTSAANNLGPDSEEGDAEAPASSPRPWQFLLGLAWRRKWLIALGLVIGLLCGVVAWEQQKPVYTSSALVLVVKKRPNALPMLGAEAITLEDFEDYLATHIVLLKSPVILERAARKPEVQSLPLSAGQGWSAAALQASLAVSRDRPKDAAAASSSNQVLRLSYSGGSAAECPVVLQAVIDSYKDFLAVSYRDSSGETFRLIVEARQVLEQDLAQKAAEYREFRQNAPLLWKGKDGLSLYQEILVAAQSKRAALQLRRAEIQGEITALENALSTGRSAAELAAVMAAFPARTDLRKSLQDQLLPLLLQERTLLENYGADHPQVKLIHQQIELTRRFLVLPAGAETQRPAAIADGLTATTVQAHLHSLKLELDALRTAERSVAELFEQEHDAARKLTNYDLQDELLRADLARIQQLYDSILKRMQEVNLVKGLGGYEARLISPPSIEGDGCSSLWSSLVRPGFLGLLAGLGLAYLADITDKRFRTPEEIGNSLHVPVVGHIPLMRDAAAKAGHVAVYVGPAFDRILCCHYRPHSLEAEAYRAVRTALYFNTGGAERKVIQITSPDQADGKTTLAANLAVSMAHSGKKVVLIDADFRRPRLHTIFGISKQVGLGSAIAGEVGFGEAVHETGVPGLALLPSGRGLNPAELLTSPRFEELLARIRAQYDVVLIDTPPLLAVTDASVVAARVDGVLLTIRITKNGRPQTERAKELLDALQVPVLGVVVNAVDARAGYGSYYRYGQGHGYYAGSPAGDDDARVPDQRPRAAPKQVPTGQAEPRGPVGGGQPC